jgi:hypothetical protein
MGITELSWLTILVAAIMGFVVGGIWYGPIMGRRWLVAVGLTEADVQNGSMPMIYGFAFVLSLIASAMLAWLLSAFANLEVFEKILVALGIAAGFIVPAIGTNYLFSQKSRGLFLIDATYWLLFYLAMGTVYGLL